jgi:hypothetical protein
MLMMLRCFTHHPVTMFFRDDRRRRNAWLKGIAADNGPRIPTPFGPATRRCHIAIDKHLSGIAPKLSAQALNRSRHGQHRRTEYVQPIDVINIHNAYRPLAPALYRFFQLGTARGAEFLAVIQSRRARFAQQYCGSHHWPRKWPAPCLIHTENHMRQAGYRRFSPA